MKTKEDSSLSNAQQTIIQCPGCQTKFAVETTAISQLDFPRFHCSRCDNVFGLDQSSKFQPQMVQEKPEKIFESQEPAKEETSSHPDNLAEEPVVADPEEPTFAMDSFRDEVEETVEEETPKFEIDIPPVVQTASSPIEHSSISTSPMAPSYTEEISTEPAASSSLYRGLEIPKQYDSTIAPVAPRETETIEASPAPSSRREKKNDPLKDQMELQFSSTHFTKPTPQPEASIPSPAVNPYKTIAETLAKERAEVYSAKASARKDASEQSTSSSIGSIAKITPPSGDADYPQLFDNAFLKDGELGRFGLGAGRISGSTLFFMAPIIAVLICLALLGSYLKNNLNAGTSFASLLFSPPAKVAPAGLVIKNPKYRKVTLESGEDVRLISGTLVNSSAESFRDVKLEGLAFDDAGHPLTKVKVDAASSLAKTRVKSMSVDMIKTMQTTTPRKRYELKPGDSQDFEMALVDDASTRARYFSARIYSVK